MGFRCFVALQQMTPPIDLSHSRRVGTAPKKDCAVWRLSLLIDFQRDYHLYRLDMINLRLIGIAFLI